MSRFYVRDDAGPFQLGLNWRWFPTRQEALSWAGTVQEPIGRIQIVEVLSRREREARDAMLAAAVGWACSDGDCVPECQAPAICEAVADYLAAKEGTK